jgi:hypothetical protein
MNELITDVKSLELETIKNLKNSKSLNTLRAYQSDFNDFSLFLFQKWITVNANSAKNYSIIYNTFVSFL